MKKLFSAMLAATMVAGAAVTAFAGIATDGIKNEDYDFGLMGAYTDKGGKLIQKEAGTKIDGGDKLYFPILVSGEELIDQKDSAKDDNGGTIDENQMYFATKASEVKGLKASVKDEVGGKYIDSASIVKKDIEITNKGETVTNKKDEVLGKLTNKGADTSVSGAKIADKSALLKKNGLVEVDVAVATVPETLGTFVEDTTSVKSASVAKDSAILKTDGDVKVGVKITGTTATLTYDTQSASVETNVGGTVKLGGLTLEFDTTKAAALTDGNITVGTVSGYKSATPSTDAKLKLGSDEFSISGFAGATAQTVTLGDLEFTLDKTAVNGLTDGAKIKVGTIEGYEAGVAGTKSIGKVYCVEVKMDDYYKPEETEVEFNIKLKDGGKVAFDTDDDKLASPAFYNGTFDLGRDTETLSAKDKKAVKGVEVKKFKKGDLEILIGKDTRSVQLDEAITTENKKEDVDNIYIENDKTIDNAFTFEVKASDQDDLYLELNQDAVKDLAVSNQKADLIFFNFPGKPEFDFTGTATFAVEDEDADNYFYEIVDGELVETNAKFKEDDGVFELRTNKLTSYVISDKELDTAKDKEDKDVNDKEEKDHEQAGGDTTIDSSNTSGDKTNANTGAADLIGVASALAVVSVAAAGAVALKK